ncbi:MAG: hypothetical protein Q8Q48_01170 [Candidatus Staskawiczbacteria bacterium]|nr:hypothetical protein [Candidatus Staskawiczbacteria bacterium]
MSFSVSNSRRSKPLRPDAEFPITEEKKVVAVLVMKAGRPDEVHVTLVGEGVVISLGNGATPSGEDRVVRAESFIIHNLRTGREVAVRYNH